VVLVQLPPAVGRAIDRATSNRSRGPILLNTRGTRMDRHAATRRLHRLAESAGISVARMHPHMLRHTFVTTMQMSRIASDASFRSLRERALPAAQAAALPGRTRALHDTAALTCGNASRR
jgi:integrase